MTFMIHTQTYRHISEICYAVLLCLMTGCANPVAVTSNDNGVVSDEFFVRHNSFHEEEEAIRRTIQSAAYTARTGDETRNILVIDDLADSIMRAVGRSSSSPTESVSRLLAVTNFFIYPLNEKNRLKNIDSVDIDTSYSSVYGDPGIVWATVRGNNPSVFGFTVFGMLTFQKVVHAENQSVIIAFVLTRNPETRTWKILNFEVQEQGATPAPAPSQGKSQNVAPLPDQLGDNDEVE